MRTVAHVTHEAVQKIGGIGAVLQGLITSKPYCDAVDRTILIGPMSVEHLPNETSFGGDLEILFNSVTHYSHTLAGQALEQVCRDHNVHILYGNRRLHDPHNGTRVKAEFVLVDVAHVNLDRLNEFKYRLWDAYQIDSSRYENIWDYEMYVRLGAPALSVLKSLGAADHDDECVVLAHEFMGLPTALGAMQDESDAFRSVFYAHEVATMRRLVEEHPGHDTAFYNLLKIAEKKGLYLPDVWGQQDGFYRHALVEKSHHCNRIFAVGHYVLKELKFIGPEFADADIDVTYNGIPAEKITLEQKIASKERLRDYAEALCGDRPDYFFTHVSRMLPSKGMWRDWMVLEEVERELRKSGKTGLCFILSTEIGPRRPQEILDMERWWNWPLAHREVRPDLSHGEAVFYEGVQAFNASSRQLKMVYINQFGFEHGVCGLRMPEHVEFMDIRRGSDVEFGQSIYEPFGIAQLEPLTFGGICVFTPICGCAGFIDQVNGGTEHPNILLTDYCELPKGNWTQGSLMEYGRRERHALEELVARKVGRELAARLPGNDDEMGKLIDSGYELACKMSWDAVAGRFVMPGIEAICNRPQAAEVA